MEEEKVDIPKYSALWRDYCFGWRCKYLILYGVLPAALISLGAVKVEPITLPPTDEIVRLIALVIIACIPMCLTYLFIKFKVDQYYLIKKCNITRASFMIFVIIFLATIIGVLGRYSIATHPAPWDLRRPFIESLLTAAISLFGSFTLFMAILLGKTDRPGLPSKSYVVLVSSIKQSMSLLTKNDRLIWKAEKSKKDIQHLIHDITECKNKIQALKNSDFCRENEKNFIDELNEDIKKLERSADDIKDNLDGESWKKYFAKFYDETLNEGEEEGRASINNIRCTRWS